MDMTKLDETGSLPDMRAPLPDLHVLEASSAARTPIGPLEHRLPEVPSIDELRDGRAGAIAPNVGGSALRLATEEAATVLYDEHLTPAQRSRRRGPQFAGAIPPDWEAEAVLQDPYASPAEKANAATRIQHVKDEQARLDARTYPRRNGHRTSHHGLTFGANN